MLVNLHTHTTFCDGKNTPEEIVLAAIDQGFSTIGFSGHGNTPFDLRYCMTDVEGYIREVTRVRQIYGDRIEILLGLEEDGFAPADRSRFEVYGYAKCADTQTQSIPLYAKNVATI